MSENSAVERIDRNWARWGLAPLPVGCPPYRLLGSMPTQVWVSTFDAERWAITWIDDRFLVDRSLAPRPSEDAVEASPVQRGDVVILVGEGQGEGVDDEMTVWAPSLVVSVKGRSGGLLSMDSIRDSWYDTMPLADFMARAPQWAAVFKSAARGQTLRLDREVLSPWGLDVWCPYCGELGTPIMWGMPPGPPSATFEDGSLRPWPGSATAIGGCVIGEGSARFGCYRCGTGWGGRVLVEPPDWDQGEVPAPPGRPARPA